MPRAGTLTSIRITNGLGDRLAQSVDGVVTRYMLDLNAGLTQVLSDGTNTYLYGLSRISLLIHQRKAAKALGRIRLQCRPVRSQQLVGVPPRPIPALPAGFRLPRVQLV